ncbi:MAG TPA: UDP-glucose 4-epimerase GalE [Desulfovibrio sp.]|jgi:UDP-glucose-4-epimerase GalE|uniref:UDP-glucose 4-epimerase GalE n=1 Tax=Desulfovibrio TaxID=872 RepID=UPI002A464424|nr:UDP-glucose 4-epimerase GalE [Desulfovibrio sp.]MDY0305959.1 UDP-glucose 4-epimerase GalE [Desulfovibrionaceae bacterium]HMM38035.1 UDP-glucose 4-epimerase GalE [Desulfovibrio sp.]
MPRAVLVTGGAGYIGGHACKALARAGYLPVTLDDLSAGHEWAVKWGPLVRADVADRAALDAVFREHRPEGVLHFAARIEVGESMRDPGKYYGNNCVASLRLLEAMRDHGCRRIVFSSTCAVYGAPQRLPLTEDHPQWPVNTYGWSKFTVERMLEDFHRAHGIANLRLRYFNAAGADPDAELGEEHDPETHLIPLVLRAAAGRGAIKVFGRDYDTPDGTCLRDYIHVTDLARAHVSALNLLERGGSQALNLGVGAGFSVREVLDTAERVTGRSIPREDAPRREGDPAALLAEPTAARRALDWEPEYGLEDMIAHAWAWMNR